MEWAGFAALCGLQFAVSVLGFGLLVLTDMYVDGCDQLPAGRACDYTASGSAHLLYVAGMAAIAIAVVVAGIVLGGRRRHVWWIPAAGTAGVMALCIVAVSLNQTALGGAAAG